MDKVTEVLGITSEMESKSERLIGVDSYLKIRFFFIDKKATRQELIHLIASVSVSGRSCLIISIDI